MSTMVDVSAPKAEDRAVLATRRLCETLELGNLKPKDLKNLTTALAEIAADEAKRNTAFAQKILAVFRQLTPVAAPAAPRARGRTPSRPIKPKLVPIRSYDPGIFGGDKPIDPYMLLHIYGEHQLRAALEELPPAELKRSVQIVEDRHPGTKPGGRAAKAALVDYVERYVLGD